MGKIKSELRKMIGENYSQLIRIKELNPSGVN